MSNQFQTNLTLEQQLALRAFELELEQVHFAPCLGAKWWTSIVRH